MSAEAVPEPRPVQTFESRTQAFFADLANETRKPHYGGQAKELFRGLLTRAQEAGIYTPKEPS